MRHKDGVMELSCDPKTGLMRVKWLTDNVAPTASVLQSYQTLMLYIKHFNVSLLLIDSRERKGEIIRDNHEMTFHYLAKELVKTSIRKVARLGSKVEQQEATIQPIIGKLASRIISDMQFQEFEDEESALNWLLATAE